MIQLYIAASLDGFIAREDGSLDWLEGLPNPNNIDYGYADFYAGVDTVVLGRKTYEEVLGFGVEWPYANCTTYVLSSTPDYPLHTERTELLNKVDTTTIQRLRANSQKHIWLVGGGELVRLFLDLDAVDELILTLIPVVLGKGIPLFPNQPKETHFELRSSTPFETGAVTLTYRRKPAVH